MRNTQTLLGKSSVFSDIGRLSALHQHPKIRKAGRTRAWGRSGAGPSTTTIASPGETDILQDLGAVCPGHTASRLIAIREPQCTLLLRQLQYLQGALTASPANSLDGQVPGSSAIDGAHESLHFKISNGRPLAEITSEKVELLVLPDLQRQSQSEDSRLQYFVGSSPTGSGNRHNCNSALTERQAVPLSCAVDPSHGTSTRDSELLRSLGGTESGTSGWMSCRLPALHGRQPAAASPSAHQQTTSKALAPHGRMTRAAAAPLHSGCNQKRERQNAAAPPAHQLLLHLPGMPGFIPGTHRNACSHHDDATCWAPSLFPVDVSEFSGLLHLEEAKSSASLPQLSSKCVKQTGASAQHLLQSMVQHSSRRTMVPSDENSVPCGGHDVTSTSTTCSLASATGPVLGMQHPNSGTRQEFFLNSGHISTRADTCLHGRRPDYYLDTELRLGR